MWYISEIKQQGKFAFHSNYWRCVLVAIILTIVTAASTASASGSGDINDTLSLQNIIQQGALYSGLSVGLFTALLASFIGLGIIISFAIKVFLSWPLEIGCKSFFLENLRGKSSLETIGSAFTTKYIRNVVTMLASNLIIGVGFVLLVIPGIILSYSFRMVPYILKDNPYIGTMDALNLSREIMKGNKWHTFLLDLSFIGWILLSVITLGIVGVFYLNPYRASVDAALYEQIR